MVAQLLTVGALCEKVELQTAFYPESLREGAKARLGGEVLCFGASGDDGDRGGGLSDSLVVSSKPSWLFGQGQTSVVSGKFLANVG